MTKITFIVGGSLSDSVKDYPEWKSIAELGKSRYIECYHYEVPLRWRQKHEEEWLHFDEINNVYCPLLKPFIVKDQETFEEAISRIKGYFKKFGYYYMKFRRSDKPFEGCFQNS